jgi:hypothetical protein
MCLGVYHELLLYIFSVENPKRWAKLKEKPALTLGHKHKDNDGKLVLEIIVPNEMTYYYEVAIDNYNKHIDSFKKDEVERGMFSAFCVTLAAGDA